MEHASQPQQAKLRRSPNQGMQAAIWVWSLLAVIALLALALVWGLRHRLSIQAPGVSPELPTLPGQPVRPEKP